MRSLLIAATLVLPAGVLAQDPPKPATPPVVEQPAKGTQEKQGTGKEAQQQGPQGKPAQGPGTGQQTGGKLDPAKEPGKEPAIERPPTDQPMPRGADPADIAAIQSAQKMLEAERKLAQMIKEGKVTGLDKIVTFDELTAWPYEDGLKGMPRSVRDLDGKKVLMTGFMLPIDEVQNIKEFLLVQSLWACCYGQPPDINGIVRVVMPKGKTTDYFFDPLKLTGTFRVEATVIDGYCVDIFQLQVETLEAIR